jgi:PAS domain S-box-containing protein
MITILYADDEEVLLQVGKVFLERNKDYSVDTVTSATKALGMMDTKHYDAVISDYQMPGMDGIAFLHEVRNRGNVVPFILFTGKGREEIVIQALNEGADFYLQKGGDPQSQFAELSHKVQLAVEKRRAEARIRDHERREADIINFLPDATFAIDAAGTVIAWNRAMEEMTGIPAAEMLGRGNYEYSLPLYRERRPILIDRILDPGPGFEEYPTIQRHGDQLTAEINLPHMNDGRGMQIWLVASPLYDREGKIVGAIESVRDVTSRIRSEKVLQDAETKFASVFENNPIPLTLVTADDGAFSNVNAAFLKNTGYELDQVIGKTPWDLGLFVIREEYERLAGELRSKGYVNGMEVQCRPKAGGIQYCSFSSCIVTIAGRPHILSTIENITARRAVEDALRESEEKYRDLFDSITDAIFVHHLNREKSGAGTFIEVNDPACRMLGYTRDELRAPTPLDTSVPILLMSIPVSCRGTWTGRM